MTVTVKIPDSREEADQAGSQRAEDKARTAAKPRNRYLQFLSEQWLVFCFGLACIFAWRWPSKNSHLLVSHPPCLLLPPPLSLCEKHERSHGFLQDVASTGGPIRSEYTILYGSVAVIFLISGLQLSTQKLRENLFNWRLHLIVQGLSFVLIPLIWLGKWPVVSCGCYSSSD